MKGNGKMVNITVKENFPLKMEKYMKVNGKIIK